MKLEQLQQRVEELSGASIRALTGKKTLRFRGRMLHDGLRPIRYKAPHLVTDPTYDDFKSYRGAADGLSLRLALSDAEIFSKHKPDHPVQQFIVDVLEQLRVESIVPPEFPGIKQNVDYRFEAWCNRYYKERLTESHVGMLIYTFYQVVWAKLNYRQVFIETEDLIEGTRFHLMPIIGTTLRHLVKSREHQSDYAKYSVELAAMIFEMIDQESVQQLQHENTESDDDEVSQLANFINFDDVDQTLDVGFGVAGESHYFEKNDVQYRVFTREYDKEVVAGKKVRPDLLKELRERLDKQVRAQGVNISRLSKQLAQLLSMPKRDGWDFEQEEGYLDARRLSMLVTSPNQHNVYRMERHQAIANSQVTILIDCSGSMTERIEPVSTLVDILARSLDSANVQTEILGYTTNNWNGGQCQQDWMSQGRPKTPGRLNELCHLIYKDADTSWRRARSSIAALLKPDLFKEGIDGEAVEWASKRLIEGDCERKLLIVISDGCPMDSATNLANDRYYLDNHLRKVIDTMTRQHDIEIFGLGVGLDLSVFYEHSLALDLSKNLSNQVFDDIIKLIAGRHHR